MKLYGSLTSPFVRKVRVIIEEKALACTFIRTLRLAGDRRVPRFAGAGRRLIEVGLRSHADGCDTRQPVGFLGGWYVEPTHRGNGVGRALMCPSLASRQSRTTSGRSLPTPHTTTFGTASDIPPSW